MIDINGVLFDFWYGDSLDDVTKADCSFCPGSIYRGNIWKGSEIIGDYESQDSIAIESIFPGIFGN